MKRLAVVIVAAVVLTGCGAPNQGAVKPEYVFETVGVDENMIFRVVRVTNTKTGGSMKILKRGAGEWVVLPDGF
jgi:uncharacterized protein YcfL